MPFTVFKMLELPLFHGSSVLAGADGSDRAIGGITILEGPDFAGVEMKGEIVITTAFILDRFQDCGVNYVLECSGKQAAGLCIKPDPSGTELPENILSTAEELHFPVVLLPPDASFGQLISTVSYEVLRREGYNGNLSFEENFFQELITSIQDRDTLLKRGAMIGLRHDELLCALLIQPTVGTQAQSICDFCHNQWDHRCYTLTKNTRVMVALRLTIPDVSKEAIVELARDLLGKLQAAIPSGEFRIGVGRCYKELANFKRSFFEACSALSFSMLSHATDPVSHFDDLGVYRILFDYKNRDELYRLYRSTVGTIADYDRENQTEYLETIRTFFSQNYSINNTAKKMFIHYNTILYRLNKIKTLFGIDLNNEEERINLYVCLRAADSQDLWRTF